MARGLFIKISPCLACIVALGLNTKRPRIESVYVVLTFSPDAARAKSSNPFVQLFGDADEAEEEVDDAVDERVRVFATERLVHRVAKVDDGAER